MPSTGTGALSHLQLSDPACPLHEQRLECCPDCLTRSDLNDVSVKHTLLDDDLKQHVILADYDTFDETITAVFHRLEIPAADHITNICFVLMHISISVCLSLPPYHHLSPATGQHSWSKTTPPLTP